MRFLILFLIVGMMISCKKNVGCKVTVYRSNNTVLPNVKVEMDVYTTASSYATSRTEYTTNSNGSFEIKDKFSNKTFIKLSCCDGSNGCTYTELIKAKELGQKYGLHFH
jgi:hypothetical protein